MPQAKISQRYLLRAFASVRISSLSADEVERSDAIQQDQFKASKEVSVMAWIENQFGDVLLLKQTRGNKLWTLPGGKVRQRESLKEALRREVEEEIGLQIQFGLAGRPFRPPAKGGDHISLHRPNQEGIATQSSPNVPRSIPSSSVRRFPGTRRPRCGFSGNDA